MTNAEYVRGFLERYHLSRHMLATQMECTPSMIARIESGEVEPSREWWDKFQYLSGLYEEQWSNRRTGESTRWEVNQMLMAQALREEMEENDREEEMADYGDTEEETQGPGFISMEPSPEDEAVMEDPGQAIRDFRMEYGLSLKEAASLLQIRDRELAAMEGGRATPEEAKEMIRRIMEAFQQYE